MTIFEQVQFEIKKKFSKHVERHTSLKEIGIDSLDLLDFIIEIEKKFGIKLNDDELFNLQTIDDVVKKIEEIKK